MPTAGENPLLGSFAEAGDESWGQRSRSNAGSGNLLLLLVLPKMLRITSAINRTISN